MLKNNNTVFLTEPKTYYKLGIWYLNKKQYSKALQYLKKTTELEPNHIEANDNLAKIYLAFNDPNLALEYYEKIALIKKNDWDTKKTLLELYLKEKQYDKASNLLKLRLHWVKGDLNWKRRFFGTIKKDKKTKDDYIRTLFQLTYTLREKEKYYMALKYGKLLAKKKNDSISHYLLATIYEAINDYDMAQKEFSYIVQYHNPTSYKFYEHIYIGFKENLIIDKAK